MLCTGLFENADLRLAAERVGWLREVLFPIPRRLLSPTCFRTIAGARRGWVMTLRATRPRCMAVGSNRTFTFDAENRVVTAIIPNIGAITYACDGEGRRVSKTVTGLAGSTFVYDAMGNLVAE